MSFGNSDREFARPTSLPEWLREFAEKELKKKGNPFEDIRNLFQQKNDVTAVEKRVQELRELVGLDKIEKKAAKDDIFGGLGDGEPDGKFDPDQLEKGIRVELEHTDDPVKAKEIAKDHLTESKDFKDGDGAKYYDKLDDLEEEIKDELTKNEASKKKVLLAHLIKTANQLEDEGKVKEAKVIDNFINKMAESFAKDKDKDENILDKRPELQRVIDNVCTSRGGFVDVPAVMQMLQNERLKDVKLTEKDRDDLKDYIKQKIKDSKKDVGRDDDLSEMSYVVFVVNEDDGNNDIFDNPTRM